MNVNINDLRARFMRALSEAGAQRSGASVFEELLARYGEAHRRYHTIAHVDSCAGWLDWYRGSALHPERVELALWFHDAVYDPCKRDNERQSAALSRLRLDALGVPSAALCDIEAHVLATECHRSEHPDGKLVIDLDLAILGSPSATFARFERQIREEYVHVPEASFRAGRAAVLRTFLARPEIFRTPALREELEARARSNLERRLLELAAPANWVASHPSE
jgi:predicted metal-dependent HD superfamily phosphohydrolase